MAQLPTGTQGTQGTQPPAIAVSPGAGDPRSYAVGVVNYHSYGELDDCLDSLKSQALPPLAVIVIDADPDLEELSDMRERHPEVFFEPRPNRGYAAGANEVLRQVELRAPESRFVLVMNPDLELDFYFADNLLTQVVKHPEVALATGKLLRPDGATIDSTGIVLPPNRRPRDRGSEEIDRGQYDTTGFVFGASGAAMMIRRSAVEDLAIEGEVFDEDFFLYHEDTDLSWRANLLGWRVLYVADAIGTHARRWRSYRRFAIDAEVRRHSFKNHYLQMIKNETGLGFLRHLPVILVWEIARLFFALLRDREMFPAYGEAWRFAPRAWAKRRGLQHRARERASA